MKFNTFRGRLLILSILVLYYGHDSIVGRSSAYLQICELVYEKIYLPESQMTPWYNECIKRSKKIRSGQNSQDLIYDLQNQMAALNISHLNLYNEEESKGIWQGEYRETGISSEFLDGDLVIFKIIKDSPADLKGLKRGDIIEKINDEHPSSWAARAKKGKFSIHRLNPESKFNVVLDVKTVWDDQSVSLETITPKTGMLKVPSFRSEFFDQENWKAFFAKINSFEKIIVDLRGNEGGNFVAGLRFLSPFLCTTKEIGSLVKPRSNKNTEDYFEDDTDDEIQIDILDKSSLVHLQTFADYGCFKGSLAVLIDSNTASTAELVAQALRDFAEAKVLGNPSSGQLLVGVWYPMPDLSPGVRLSIPEAVYQTKKGLVIERNGIYPDKVLYYNKRDLASAQDNWIDEAMVSF